ncbi:MAG: hypothetical protein JO091_08305 [Acidobacteriaceae bacterium]|nr:hypothetical protein [Acidobacteriaceae bacterium]
MSKQDEAGLILKLYELRREEVMRKARDWYFREFNPESIQDYTQTLFSEHSGYLRMVVTYWDMAAALVNHGAISFELFDETQGEHIGVFAKIEPLLGEIRGLYNPRFAANLEKLVDDTPNGRERVALMRERMNSIRAQASGMRSKAAQN